MRLHSLGVTAFGPFADTVEVDFDSLSSAGLFLLTGDTGAGKTSVLDAVCFALYGDVPGDRGVAKRLRSDHAAPGVAPEVVLEATLAGRRFRIRRSPAWQRPKKRGSGTTPQQATVTLTEWRDGSWELVSNRLDEVGDVISTLLGMTLAQFCQVAMLPQGRFQSFLKARSDERQAVLQQLFRTGRFARMESWLREHRLELSRASRQHHESVAGLLNRAAEVSGAPWPEQWDIHALEPQVESGELRGWSRDLSTEAAELAATEEARLAQVRRLEEESRTRLEQARHDARQRERHREASARAAELEVAAPAHARRERQLADARRASAVVPVVRQAEQSSFDAAAARLRTALSHTVLCRELDGPLGAHLRDQGARLPDPGRTGQDIPVAALRDVLTARLHRLAPLLDVDERLRDARQHAATLARDLDVSHERIDVLAAELAELPTALERLEQSLAGTLEAASVRAAREQECGRLEAQLDALSRLVACEAELEAAESERAVRRGSVQDLTEVWLDLRETRLHGMAAEIAGALAVGGSCPVCGSCSHPAPARPSPGAPDAEAERSALRDVDDAKALLHAHDERVQELRTRRSVLRAAAGDLPAPVVEERLAQCRSEREDAERAAARAAELESERLTLRDRLESARLERQALEVEAAGLEVQHRAHVSEAEAVQRQRDDALAGTGSSSIDDLRAALEALDAEARRFLELHREAQRAGERADRARAECERVLADQGFADALEALRAHRDEPGCRHLQEQVDEHVREHARVRAVLDDPEVRAAGEAPAEDLLALRSAHGEHHKALLSVQAQVERSRASGSRLSGLDRELEEALETWAPLRERLRMATDLAQLAEGRSADNRWQMRLSAYVLGYRLSQVVAAANGRLAAMSDQRYSLEHTGQRGARETRGGLSLLVRDDWSGESRDPATLSGGETFVVSLALALGLADVITEEAGGADLDTLFVDEGFGSLDSGTLDDVLDTLDALRDGGRVVGLVSHVGEMRERIPAQLRVTKGRKGSTLATVVG